MGEESGGSQTGKGVESIQVRRNQTGVGEESGGSQTGKGGGVDTGQEESDRGGRRTWHVVKYKCRGFFWGVLVVVPN